MNRGILARLGLALGITMINVLLALVEVESTNVLAHVVTFVGYLAGFTVWVVFGGKES